MRAGWQSVICLAYFVLGFQGTISSTSSSQSYGHRALAIQDRKTESSAILQQANEIERSKEAADDLKQSRKSFSVTGQYSKSILVNTQSKTHSHIYDPDMPIFDLDHSTNVTALLGKTAVLNCRVRNVGNRTVSWLRHRDIHLLTVGRFSYTTDQRFSAVHADESEDWLLKIHYLQKRDAGWYTCQISTTPPVSNMVYLSIVEPETSIVGRSEVYINSGGQLSLICKVKYSPEPPAFIFWYHNQKLVSYDHSHGGIQVQIEKGAVSTSRLLVQLADKKHSGKYTCHPSNSNPKSVTVHVLQGEKPAAIQHENNSAIAISPFTGANIVNFYFYVSTYFSILSYSQVIYR